MSTGFKMMVDSLQSDFRIISEFLENPSKLLAQYDLTDEERDVVLERNYDKLAELCGSAQLAAGVLSGAHTPTCANGSVHLF